MNNKYSHPGTIILLNGTSSSGKSAILEMLQAQLHDYVVFKIDDYYPSAMKQKAKEFGWQELSGIDPWLYVKDYVDTKTAKVHFGTEVRAYIFGDISFMYQEAKKALLEGKNIIIDTVFEYDPEYEKFVSYFKDFTMLKVLVYCSLDVIIERVQRRNELEAPEEHRTLFQSFEQFPALYKVQENDTEQFVATCSTHDMKDALKQSIQELIDDAIHEKYIPRLKSFEISFIKKFKLDEQTKIKLVSRHHYDVILNSSFTGPEQLAKKITDILAQRK